MWQFIGYNWFNFHDLGVAIYIEFECLMGVKGWHQRCKSSTINCGNNYIHRRNTMKIPRRLRKLACHSRVLNVRWLHNWLRLVMITTKCFHYGMVPQAFKELLLFYGVNYKVHMQLVKHSLWSQEGYKVGQDYN